MIGAAVGPRSAGSVGRGLAHEHHDIRNILRSAGPVDVLVTISKGKLPRSSASTAPSTLQSSPPEMISRRERARVRARLRVRSRSLLDIPASSRGRSRVLRLGEAPRRGQPRVGSALPVAPRDALHRSAPAAPAVLSDDEFLSHSHSRVGRWVAARVHRPPRCARVARPASSFLLRGEDAVPRSMDDNPSASGHSTPRPRTSPAARIPLPTAPQKAGCKFTELPPDKREPSQGSSVGAAPMPSAANPDDLPQPGAVRLGLVAIADSTGVDELATCSGVSTAWHPFPTRRRAVLVLALARVLDEQSAWRTRDPPHGGGE